MDQKDFSRRIELLINYVNAKNNKEFIMECDDRIVHGVCELCFNILRPEREIVLNKQTLENLKPFRRILHNLANSRLSIKNKRRLLSAISEDFVPILKRSIVPTLKKKYLSDNN